MAKPRHSIGNHEFVLLNGEVPKIRRELEVILRPGMTGYLRRRSGLQSGEFKLRSMVDMVSIDYAREELGRYSVLIDQVAQPLVKDGKDYLTDVDPVQLYGVLVAVIDVVPIRMQTLSVICGGINDGNVELRAEWTLRLVLP